MNYPIGLSDEQVWFEAWKAIRTNGEQPFRSNFEDADRALREFRKRFRCNDKREPNSPRDITAPK